MNSDESRIEAEARGCSPALLRMLESRRSYEVARLEVHESRAAWESSARAHLLQFDNGRVRACTDSEWQKHLESFLSDPFTGHGSNPYKSARGASALNSEQRDS